MSDHEDVIWTDSDADVPEEALSFRFWCLYPDLFDRRSTYHQVDDVRTEPLLNLLSACHKPPQIELDRSLMALVGNPPNLAFRPAPGYAQMVQLLLDFGADPNTSVNVVYGAWHTFSVLWMAIQSHKLDVVRMLIAHNACLRSSDPWKTLLHNAQTTLTEISAEELTRALRECHGACDVLLQASCHDYPFDDFTKGFIPKLLQMGANPLAKDSEGRNAADILRWRDEQNPGDIPQWAWMNIRDSYQTLIKAQEEWMRTHAPS